MRNRLAALATHGRQNCKQSGVVLERTVQQIVRLIHGRIKGVISRKSKLWSDIFFSLKEETEQH